jgi:hypothetical protein
MKKLFILLLTTNIYVKAQTVFKVTEIKDISIQDSIYKEIFKFIKIEKISSKQIDIYFSNDSTKSIDVVVYNVIGKKITHKLIKCECGINKFELDINYIPNNIYFVELSSGKQKITSRFCFK